MTEADGDSSMITLQQFPLDHVGQCLNVFTARLASLVFSWAPKNGGLTFSIFCFHTEQPTMLRYQRLPPPQQHASTMRMLKRVSRHARHCINIVLIMTGPPDRYGRPKSCPIAAADDEDPPFACFITPTIAAIPPVEDTPTDIKATIVDIPPLDFDIIQELPNDALANILSFLGNDDSCRDFVATWSIAPDGSAIGRLSLNQSKSRYGERKKKSIQRGYYPRRPGFYIKHQPLYPVVQEEDEVSSRRAFVSYNGFYNHFSS